ncbi:MAG: NnrU family protein [Rhodospirillales bacterium]|nr:NnrU family protein [Rhodospirillales bacterium]
MWNLIVACVLFVGSHFLLSSNYIRPRLVGVFGETGFAGIHSIISIVLLVWAVRALNVAPEIILWTPPIGLRHISLTVMPLACILIVAGLTTPNPTMAGTNIRNIASRGPVGIMKVTRHPFLWGVGLWGLVHILANGDAAALTFFGALTVLALGGTLHLDARRRATLGKVWTVYAAQTSNLPFQAMAGGRTKLVFSQIGWWRIGLGLALYLVLLSLHRTVIGVPPFFLP